MQTHSFTIARLEQALRSWEELMWSLSIIMRTMVELGKEPAIDVAGPLVHYGELRRHLLALRSQDDFDYDRFVCRKSRQTDWLNISVNEMLLPYLLGNWCTASRRVYHIDPDLQALLMSTSLKDLSWGDVYPPFESFGISLEQPIETPGTPPCDFLLISPIDSVTGERYKQLPVDRGLSIPEFPWYFMGLKTQLARWEPSELRSTVDRRVRQGDLHGGARLIAKKNVMAKNLGLTRGYIVGRKSDVLVSELIGELSREDPKKGTAYDIVVTRLVVGLCMYLRMMRSNSPHVGPWARIRRTKMRDGTPSPDAVTNEAEVCTVSSVKRLSAEDRDLFIRYATGRLSGIELQCHFREGHWRRPPGKGHDPEAEKTVQVDPTIVRPDRWPESGLPRGRHVDLSTRH